MKFQSAIYGIFIYGLLAFTLPVSGQTFDLEDKREHVVPPDYIQFFEDTKGQVSIDDILSGDHPRFQSYSENDWIGGIKSTYWARITLKNRSKNTLNWMLFVGKNDFIDAFIVSQNSIRHFRSGYLYKASEKEVTLGGYYVPLPINHDQTLELYLKVREELHADPEFALTIISNQEYWERINQKKLLDNIFQGVVIIMILYGLLVYFGSKDVANIYYALYLTSLSIVFLFLTGILRESILKETPEFTRFAMLMVPITAALYYLFIRSFLNIGSLLPSWSRAFRIFIISNFILAFLGLISLLTLGMFATAQLMSLLMIVNCLIGLIILFRVLALRNRDTVYYALGTTCFLITVLFDTIAWEPNSSDASTIRLGLIAEILFYSAGLGLKMKSLQKEKEATQLKLIEQLKINEELLLSREAELEKLVENRTRNLTALNSELKVYDQMISHDLKGPISNTFAAVSLLESTDLAPSSKKFVSIIKTEAQRSTNMIQALLSFSTGDKLRLEQTPIDLNVILNEVIQSLESQILEAKAEIKIDHLPILTEGVRVKIYQLFYNLFSNALKFRDTKRQLIIKVLFEELKGERFIYFDDNGTGIAKSDIKNIFKVNYRGAQAEGIEGEGIGLATCMRIAEFHGMNLSANNREDGGTRFILKLKVNT